MIQEIGAVAGFAAVLGLAVLSALNFAHARDIRRLREWAGRAPERSEPIARPAASRAAPPKIMIFARRRSRRRYSRIGTRYVAVALVGLLVLGGAAASGVAQLTGDDGGDDSGKVQAKDDDGAAIEPGKVTVAVLNGTTVPGLAATTRDQLAAAGFKKGAIDVFTDQQLAESVVQYAPGRQAEATAVSRNVGISQREPITATSRALAGDATVIVIAGADRAP